MKTIATIAIKTAAKAVRNLREIFIAMGEIELPSATTQHRRETPMLGYEEPAVEVVTHFNWEELNRFLPVEIQEYLDTKVICNQHVLIFEDGTELWAEDL